MGESMNNTLKKIPEEFDMEYLIHLLDQIKCKNNGIKTHLQKKDFQIPGLMIGESHLSFEYLRDKSEVIDLLVETIKKDALIKSIMSRTFTN